MRLSEGDDNSLGFEGRAARRLCYCRRPRPANAGIEGGLVRNESQQDFTLLCKPVWRVVKPIKAHFLETSPKVLSYPTHLDVHVLGPAVLGGESSTSKILLFA